MPPVSPRRSFAITDIARGLKPRRAAADTAAGRLQASDAAADAVPLAEAYGYGDGLISAAYTLLGSGRRKARSRQQIYEKWAFMMGDPVVSTAISLLCTAALGGHETTGDVVFIEATAEAQKDKGKMAIVDEINRDIGPLLNKVSFTVCYNAAGFGDAYARAYTAQKTGLLDLYVDELVSPPTILPFEQGNRTVAFATAIGEKQLDRISIKQMLRLKMPRRIFVPQLSVTEKAWRANMRADVIGELPIIPSAAGGSLLYEAESAYDNMLAALVGLVGQRVNDSIDEKVIGVQMAGASKEQQEALLGSIVNMLKTTKERASKAVLEGQPILERLRYILPIWNEKQVVNFDVGSAATSARASTITVDDVMFHAKMLAGCFGTDLSNIGFADQMAGAFGDGGWLRTSAQAAQRARVIRSAFAEFCNDAIDLHTFMKHGVVFEPNERPWKINFFGSISALENEQETTRGTAAATGAALVQAMDQAKNMGFTEAQMAHFLSKTLKIDEESAKLYASVVNVKTEPDQDGGGGGFGGGGFGG